MLMKPGLNFYAKEGYGVE